MSTNSVLPGKSRLFPLRLYRVIKLLFWVCISVHFCTFPLMRVSCYKTLFLCALLRISCIFPSAAFYLKSMEKLLPCAYILPCNIIPHIRENATKCNHFPHRPYNLNIPTFPTIHHAHISCLETPYTLKSSNIFQHSILSFIREKP